MSAQVQEAEGVDVDALLNTKLEQHKDLVLGELRNGLKYVILPNAVPPERFEAHLEICAGVASQTCCHAWPQQVALSRVCATQLHARRTLTLSSFPIMYHSKTIALREEMSVAMHVLALMSIGTVPAELCAQGGTVSALDIAAKKPICKSGARQDPFTLGGRQRGRAAGRAGHRAPGGARHLPGQPEAGGAAGHGRALQRVHRLPPHRLPRAFPAPQHRLRRRADAHAAPGVTQPPPPKGYRTLGLGITPSNCWDTPGTVWANEASALACGGHPPAPRCKQLLGARSALSERFLGGCGWDPGGVPCKPYAHTWSDHTRQREPLSCAVLRRGAKSGARVRAGAGRAGGGCV